MDNRKLDDCQLKQLNKMFNLYEMEGISGTVVQECNGYDDYSDCHLPESLKRNSYRKDDSVSRIAPVDETNNHNRQTSGYDDYSDCHMPPYLKERNADYDNFMFLSDYDDYSDSHMVGDDNKDDNSNSNN